jgi:hypothetical protein
VECSAAASACVGGAGLMEVVLMGQHDTQQSKWVGSWAGKQVGQSHKVPCGMGRSASVWHYKAHLQRQL